MHQLSLDGVSLMRLESDHLKIDFAPTGQPE